MALGYVRADMIRKQRTTITTSTTTTTIQLTAWQSIVPEIGPIERNKWRTNVCVFEDEKVHVNLT